MTVSTQKAAPNGLLTGLRVIEISSYVATPLCGLTLAQLGAEVVRVEPLGGAPDRTRWPLADSGTSLYWSGLNKGKRAVAVDMASASERSRVADFIVDGLPCVVVSNSDRYAEFRHDDLRRRRPDLIHALLQGRRDGGAAVDYTVQAASGFPYVTGPAGSAAPVNQVLPAWDIAAGLYLAVGLLAAERHRLVSGEGSSITVALDDVALATAGNLGYLAEAQLTSHVRTKSGNDVFGTYGRDFATADGRRIMLVILTERHWAKLLKATSLTDAFGGLEQALGVSFAGESERYRHREVISALLADWFDAHTFAEVTESFGPFNLLWEPYRTFKEVGRAGGELSQHPLFSEINQPGVGTHLAPGGPIVIDGRTSDPWPAPSVGQHNDEVLGPAKQQVVHSDAPEEAARGHGRKERTGA